MATVLETSLSLVLAAWIRRAVDAEETAKDLLAACESMLRIHGAEDYRNSKLVPCPCDGCKMARAAIAKAKPCKT